VIVGHSERRSYSHESNQKAVTRIKRAVDAGITPIYCVGETLAEYGLNQTKKIIEAQILAIFDLDATSLARVKMVGLVIAYEPVWAIGTGHAALPQHAQAVHHFIRTRIAQHDAEFAKKIRIIYGGSLTPENAGSLLKMPDIDGALVGRCALNVLAFKAICEVAGHTLAVCEAK
jgi:triosephosphate isomerase (TIM)